MAAPKSHVPTLLVVAVFSRYKPAIDWAKAKMIAELGEVSLESEAFDHSETTYYAEEMGASLRKQFFVIQGNFAPERLAAVKLLTNAWEAELAGSGRFPQRRPINIDPGYLTLSKFILASAKDRGHRIYLRDGIYAEQCLYYLDGRWNSRPWTYPDYSRTDFQAFFERARETLKHQLRNPSGG